MVARNVPPTRTYMHGNGASEKVRTFCGNASIERSRSTCSNLSVRVKRNHACATVSKQGEKVRHDLVNGIRTRKLAPHRTNAQKADEVNRSAPECRPEPELRRRFAC